VTTLGLYTKSIEAEREYNCGKTQVSPGNCYFKLPQGQGNRIYGNLKKLGQLNQAGVPAVATYRLG
jgi:hypothetical protein